MYVSNEADYWPGVSPEKHVCANTNIEHLFFFVNVCMLAMCVV